MIEIHGIQLEDLQPIVDGEVDRKANLIVEREGDRVQLKVRASRAASSLGVRFGSVTGARGYLRNGYHSWDGSFFVAPGTKATDEPPGKEPDRGFAMTALLSKTGAVVIGFERHDRFQSRFRFGGTPQQMTIAAETLLDDTGHQESETITIFAGDEVEETLRRWSRIVAQNCPPRLPKKRITGWCSWYNLYSAIDEPTLEEHLEAAREFRDTYQVSLDIFQIDDGFTPEMGDWLLTKPQFPRGMKPLIEKVRAKGFTPGLWIAPFMVGNRSRLFREHPDWVVTDRQTGEPLTQMRFYGEFRWHKRSEEYYILDITHPGAQDYIATVFDTWSNDWGARYFKVDFMLFGSEHGPERARWHRKNLSRIQIWRRMLEIARESAPDALFLGCGCPLWAGVGLVDAIRIGRDVGSKWGGEQSAESLLRDQLTRNHAAGILWQADPDCILLRQRFHELTPTQVRSLALFAGLSGGVLMTSDKLDELPQERAELFAELLRTPVERCDFPNLGKEGLIIQRILRGGLPPIENRFNPTDQPQDGLEPYEYESNLEAVPSSPNR